MSPDRERRGGRRRLWLSRMTQSTAQTLACSNECDVIDVNDDSSGGMTLHDLAAEYGVSAERIRQIEVAAMKKMRKALAESV